MKLNTILKKGPVLALVMVFTSLAEAQLANQETLKVTGRYEKTIDFIVDDDELFPGTLTIEEGQYRLLFRNNFTSSRLDFAIDDEKSARVANVEISEKRAKGDLVVNLKPGRHVIFVRQRPRWRCVLTVTEKTKK